MRNILICYYGEYPARISNIDHLYSFSRYSGQRCFYLDMGVQKIPRYLKRISFDLVIFHTNFLSARWDLHVFQRIVEKARPLINSSAVKIALPQDEFFLPSVVCDFINEFGIQHVFSVAPPSEWKKIYKKVDFSKVQFHHVLTGYLEKRTLERIHRAAKQIRERDLDIGYRAWKAEPWLGRHGLLKTRLAEIFQQDAATRGLKVDISTKAEDTLYGNAWYKFLLRCKYTISVEGGASLLDWDGTIRQRTNAFMSQHPDAMFNQIEETCFPGMDGSLSLFAISPRHLEACATRTCQILIEGDYTGVLVAGKHYIALKRDFSNLDDVFSQLNDEHLRKTIVENAYCDVVGSGNYRYEKFVMQVLDTSWADINRDKDLPDIRLGLWLAWMAARLANTFAWVHCGFRGLILYPLYQKVFEILPDPLVQRLRTLARKLLKKT